MQSDYVFSSESVTAGHPDKLCDRISDRIVASFVAEDERSRVVAESALSTGIVFVSVRLRSSAAVDISSIARETIRQVGYREGRFNDKSCTVVTSLIEDARAPKPVPEGDARSKPRRPCARGYEVEHGRATGAR